MEVQSSEKVVDGVGPTAVVIDAVEDVACRLHRQCGDDRTLAVSGDRGDARGDEKTHGLELAQLLHYREYLLSARSLRIEDGFGIVEDEDHPS